MLDSICSAVCKIAFVIFCCSLAGLMIAGLAGEVAQTWGYLPK